MLTIFIKIAHIQYFGISYNAGIVNMHVGCFKALRKRLTPENGYFTNQTNIQLSKKKRTNQIFRYKNILRVLYRAYLTVNVVFIATGELYNVLRI